MCSAGVTAETGPGGLVVASKQQPPLGLVDALYHMPEQALLAGCWALQEAVARCGWRASCRGLEAYARGHLMRRCV